MQVALEKIWHNIIKCAHHVGLSDFISLTKFKIFINSKLPTLHISYLVSYSSLIRKSKKHDSQKMILLISDMPDVECADIIGDFARSLRRRLISSPSAGDETKNWNRHHRHLGCFSHRINAFPNLPQALWDWSKSWPTKPIIIYWRKLI